MNGSRRIGDIELLRGLAVFGILIHHAQGNLLAWTTPAMDRFYAYFNIGHTIDLFFAISGFVIARDLIPKVQEVGKDRVSFFTFGAVEQLRNFDGGLGSEFGGSAGFFSG